MADASGVALSASLEDYLEAIFRIVQDKQAARAKDIGQRLNVGRSSVTGALQALASKDLINYAPYDIVTLTDKGKALAEDVVRRHEVLRDFFVRVLVVSDEDAEQAACKLEHAIPEGILQRFLEFVEFIDRCPRSGEQWIKGFGYFCQHDSQVGDCQKCVGNVMDDVRSKAMAKAAGEETTTTLAEIKPGGKASIVRIAGSGGVRRRLLDMGATTGAVIEVERVAPLGDPIEVKIKGYHLTLRKEEAQRIQVEPV